MFNVYKTTIFCVKRIMEEIIFNIIKAITLFCFKNNVMLPLILETPIPKHFSLHVKHLEKLLKCIWRVL
jgi:hypothetical protein